jgi:hypothetical protein
MQRFPSRAALLRAAWLRTPRGTHQQPPAVLLQPGGALPQPQQLPAAWAPARLLSRLAGGGGAGSAGAAGASAAAAGARRALSSEAAAAAARVKPGGRDIDYQSPGRQK